MDGDFFMIHILNYEKSWFLFSAEDSGVSSGAVPSAPPLPTISENEEEEPLLEEDFSVALLEDDQRDFEAGMVVSTSKVGILWRKKISQFSQISWFSLIRETDTKMTQSKSWAICMQNINWNWPQKTSNSHCFYLDLNDHFYWRHF